VAVTPFELDRGTQHGRIASANASDGAYLFELGHTGRAQEEFTVGDVISVYQDISAAFADSAEKLVRVTCRLVAPSIESAGVAWELTATLTVGVTTYTFYSRTIPADGRSLLLQNIGVSLATIPDPGTGRLSFNLTLVTV
jgi:hypothetical protein